MRAHARQTESPARSDAAAAPRVLLLDDNPFAVERISRVLEQAGYRLAGPAGDDEAPIREVDVVVCDVKRLGAVAESLAEIDREDRPVLIGLVPDHWQNSKCLPDLPRLMGYVAKSDVAGLLEVLKSQDFRAAVG